MPARFHINPPPPANAHGSPDGSFTGKAHNLFDQRRLEAAFVPGREDGSLGQNDRPEAFALRYAKRGRHQTKPTGREECASRCHGQTSEARHAASAVPRARAAPIPPFARSGANGSPGTSHRPCQG
jgi:hypothetical protein